MSELRVSAVTDETGGNTATINGMTPTADSLQGFRNRILNGSMVLDQRNAGAAVANSSGYVVDRWADFRAGSGRYTAQQSTTAPSGFTNSFQHTVTTAVTPAASDVYQIFQPIEGYNTADLGFGTASAQSVTVSFWVRSSVTGLYAVSLRNSASNRSYVATYSVTAANTWEQKTATIPGDTSGTWLTNNGTGILLIFDLGSGSNQNTTADAWQAGDFRRTSGCVDWISTSGATFRITGVQLEAGSVATPFERRPFGQELALCQRYYYRWVSTTTNESISTGFAYATTAAFLIIPFPMTMRIRPTALETTGTASNYRIVRNGPATINCSSVPNYSNASTSNGQIIATVASGLTAGEGIVMQSNDTSAYLGWSAEL